MKATVVLAAAASAALATAQPHGPHGHGHFHHQKRATTVTVSDPISTAFAFVLDDKTLSRDQVCAGINDGSLKFSGNVPAGICGAPAAISVAATSSTPSAAAQFFEKPSTSSSSATPPPPTTSSAAPPPSSSSSPPPAKSSSASIASVAQGAVSDLKGFMLFTSANSQSSYPDFQNGVHACGDGPPSGYGAVPVSWMPQGYSGIQIVSGSSLQGTGSVCEDGTLCSYACAPGMKMAQWPTAQPASGASIGGLACIGGTLHTTNSNSQLCVEGSGDVYVQNTGGAGISVCGTAYPGTESETIPLWIPAGSTEPLMSPIEDSFYIHMNSKTSAQYYLSEPGTTPDVACTWNGSGDGKSGNWAPIVLGAGYTGGTNWLSIQQNTPTSYAAFTGKVEIVGDSCSGKCVYQNGQYCLNGANCAPNTQNGAGCTVSCSGKATYVISF